MQVLREKIRNIRANLEFLGFNWSRVAIISVLVLSIFSLAVNTYTDVVDATQSYRLLEVEREKLREIQTESDELEREIAYFSSLEYKQQYAYDSLNLAREGEQLYVIEDLSQFTVEELPEEIYVQGEGRHSDWWDMLAILLWNGEEDIYKFD